MITEKDVNEAYELIKDFDIVVAEDVLEFMKLCALSRLKEMEDSCYFKGDCQYKKQINTVCTTSQQCDYHKNYA